jgi:hypothetical protein
MPLRLTVLVLAFIMASPPCWCGWSHATQVSHAKSCCEESAAEKKADAPAKSKDCPCQQAIKTRELVKAEVKVPPPVLADLHFEVLTIRELPQHPETFFILREEPHNHGPPGKARPLYQMACSFLI